MSAGYAAAEGRGLFRSTPLSFNARRLSLPLMVPECPHCGYTDMTVGMYDLMPSGTNPRCEAATLTFRCRECEIPSFSVVFYCSTQADPAGVGHLHASLFEQEADQRIQYVADAVSGESWTVNRRIYRTGRRRTGGPLLPSGPFIIDQHLFPAVRRLSARSGAHDLVERLSVPALSFLRDARDTLQKWEDIPR